MMNVSTLFKILMGLAVLQCISADTKLKALRNYLKMAANQQRQLYPDDVTLAEEDNSHEIVRRLPPLVPPSFNDEDHFEERQVFHIPRVGKRGRSNLITLTDELGDSTEPEDDRFIGPGRGDKVRQVFSKIPRVGRSSRSVKYNKDAVGTH